jgi:ribose 5-phosphate isomerase RpiB
MKAYILSEDESHGIALANAINAAGSTAIMEEHESNSYVELIDKAAESLENGYDLIVLVSRKPLEANIAANKTTKLRAVVCRTQTDASKARKARANIIIMDDGEFSKTSASGIMRGWAGSTPEPPSEEEPEQSVGISEMGRSVLGALSSGLSVLKKSTSTKNRVERESSEDEEGDIRKPKGGGIIKSLKYTFGLE